MLLSCELKLTSVNRLRSLFVFRNQPAPTSLASRAPPSRVSKNALAPGSTCPSQARPQSIPKMMMRRSPFRSRATQSLPLLLGRRFLKSSMSVTRTRRRRSVASLPSSIPSLLGPATAAFRLWKRPTASGFAYRVKVPGRRSRSRLSLKLASPSPSLPKTSRSISLSLETVQLS